MTELTRAQVEAIGRLAENEYRLAPDGSCANRLGHASRDVVALVATDAALWARLEASDKARVRFQKYYETAGKLNGELKARLEGVEREFLEQQNALMDDNAALRLSLTTAQQERDMFQTQAEIYASRAKHAESLHKDCEEVDTELIIVRQQLAASQARVREVEAEQTRLVAANEHWHVRMTALKVANEACERAIDTLTARCARMEEALRSAPTGVYGETHGDVIARYYAWYEGERQQALHSAQEGT